SACATSAVSAGFVGLAGFAGFADSILSAVFATVVISVHSAPYAPYASSPQRCGVFRQSACPDHLGHREDLHTKRERVQILAHLEGVFVRRKACPEASLAVLGVTLIKGLSHERLQVDKGPLDERRLPCLDVAVVGGADHIVGPVVVGVVAV